MAKTWTTLTCLCVPSHAPAECHPQIFASTEQARPEKNWCSEINDVQHKTRVNEMAVKKEGTTHRASERGGLDLALVVVDKRDQG